MKTLLQRCWTRKNIYFTWHCWVYRPRPSLFSLVSSPCPIWRYQERWRRSDRLLADWCWSVCPAENREAAWNTNAASCLLKYSKLSQIHAHTLKLLICESLRFWLKVVLTQLRMIRSPIFSPSPRSDRTRTVYLRDGKQNKWPKPPNTGSKSTSPKLQTVHVPPHQLPDKRQSVHLTPLVQVFSSDADQRELSEMPAQVHGVVTVLQLRHMKKSNVTVLLLPHHQLSVFLICVHSMHTFFMLPPRKG